MNVTFFRFGFLYRIGYLMQPYCMYVEVKKMAFRKEPFSFIRTALLHGIAGNYITYFGQYCKVYVQL